ncbi:MAG TPA: glutathione S-transferase family protein, partial [Stellaceae bacterium]|nr:glutathione S-transferase family protein [Stellaceae bacterium]
MILVGMLDSPFVRRVAVTLQHYELPFTREVLSTFGDFDRMLETNPLGKVPALRLDDGSVLVDSSVILDHLDGMVPEKEALMSRAGAARLAVQRVVAVALGLAEKSVEYRGETVRRPPEKRVPELVQRIERQIASALAWLEARAEREWLVGSRMTQADVTAAIAVTFLRHKNPELIPAGRHPRLEALAARLEALPEFQAAPFRVE